jgi:hypothetical protein
MLGVVLHGCGLQQSNETILDPPTKENTSTILRIPKTL